MGYCYSSVVLKNGSNFPMNMSVKHVSYMKYSDRKNRQRLYLYTHISYISYAYPIDLHITLVVPSRQCLLTYSWYCLCYIKIWFYCTIPYWEYLEKNNVPLLKSYERFTTGSPRWRRCWWRHLPMSDNMATPTGGEAAQGGLVKATCELSFRNEKIILRQLLNQ